MLHTVKTVPHFDREMKRLSKKYVSLKDEYEELIKELEKNPELGIHLNYQLNIQCTAYNKRFTFGEIAALRNEK